MTSAYLLISGDKNEGLAERNHVMLLVSELTGVREFELVAFPKKVIPEWDQIRVLHEEDQTTPWTLIGKGRKERSVPLVPELLETAREYLEGTRSKILRQLGCKDPNELFISHTSGRALNPKSVSNLFSTVFKRDGLSHHRVRHRFLQRIVDVALAEEVDRAGISFSRKSVLLRAAQLAGHSEVSTTLAHYVDLGFKNRIDPVTGSNLSGTHLDRVVAIDRQLLRKKAELDKFRELLGLLRSGRLALPPEGQERDRALTLIGELGLNV